MSDVYRIRQWPRHFENNKSRGIKACRYVCMPNKQDGLGLTRILAQPDGAAIFGVWCLVLQACSRQIERDGWLTDDGKPNGRPWDLDDLAFRWRRPRAEIERCLALVCDPKIAWMERLESKCPAHGTVGPRGALEGREGIEGKEQSAPAADAAPTRDDADPGDLFSPRPEQPAEDTPDAIAAIVGVFIDWRFGSDAAETRANAIELAQLVGAFGKDPVREAGERIAKRQGKKARIWQLMPELLSGGKPPPTGADDPYAVRARKLVEKHGWESCRDAIGLKPATVDGPGSLVLAMSSCWDFIDTVAAKLGEA